MIRVLHVISGDLWAGAEAQVYQLLSALRSRADVEVSAVVFNRLELASRLEAAAIPITVLEESSLGPLDLLRGIWRTVRKTGATIVHTHRFKEHILGAPAAWLAGAISLRTVHGRPEYDDTRRGAAIRKLDLGSGRLEAAIVGVSQELCAYLRTQFPARKVFCVPNGIDSAAMVRAAAQPCDTVRVEGKVNVALVGRLVGVKRGDLFLEAAALLKASYPGRFHFVVVGDGPLRPALTARAQALGLANEVRFLGHQSNSPGILRQMDCLALTSDKEGLPMVLLEALSLGVPVVAHAVGGIPEVIQGIEGPQPVTEHSAQGYAAAFANLTTRPDVCGSLLPSRYEISATAGEYAALYHRLAP